MCTRTARLSPRQMQPQSNGMCFLFFSFRMMDIGLLEGGASGLGLGGALLLLSQSQSQSLLSLAGNHEREANWARARRTNRKPRDFNSQSGDFEFGLHTPLHWPVRECVRVSVSECASVWVCVRVCLYLFNVVVLVLALGVFYGAPPEYLPLYNGVLVPASRHCRRHHRRIKSKLKPRSVSHKPVESTQS